MKAKFVKAITVIDPDSGLPVELNIYKEEAGGMMAVDGSWDGSIFSPFGNGVLDTDDSEDLDEEIDSPLFEVSHGTLGTILAQIPQDFLPYLYVRVNGKLDLHIKAEYEGVVVDIYEAKDGINCLSTAAIAYADLEK